MEKGGWPALSVPIMNDEFSRHPEQYVKALKDCGAQMVFLAQRRSFAPEALEKDFRALADNARRLAGEGFQVGCWLQSFGFGNPLSRRDEPHAAYRKITDMRGRVCGDAFCPTDERYTNLIAGLAARAAEAGCGIVMLDDDLCLNIRPGLGCACEEHLRRYSARIGRVVERSQLKEMIYSGPPSRERREWLNLMGETLKDFCRAVRRAVDQVNPDTRLGFCAGYTSWDMEGADALELTGILAGKTRPFLRLSGAPYWAEMRRFTSQSLNHIVEFTRMQAAWCQGKDVDFFTENDSYPRPRYRIPAAYIEGFDFCMAASGHGRQLKYLLDYFSRPDYETGYIDAHLRNRDVIRAAERALDGLECAGVYVHEDTRKIADMTLPEGMDEGYIMASTAFSASAALLSGLRVSTCYENRGVAAAFGDAGRTVPLTGQKGYILDFAAAIELEKRGVDTGLAGGEEMPAPGYEYFLREDDRIEVNWMDTAPGSRFYRARPRDGAEILSLFRGEDGEAPASYYYVNKQGTPFLVYLFRADTLLFGGSLYRSYYRQSQILEACRRMGQPLPAMIRRAPGCYLLCREGRGKLGIALCNFSADEMAAPRVELSGDWSEAEFIGCQGQLSGRELRLSPIAPYGFAAIALKKAISPT